jgi:hypothetical protein
MRALMSQPSANCAFESFVDDLGQDVFDHFDGGVVNVLAVDDLLATSVDDLALFVHHLVVLEHVLADLGVATLDGVLSALDGLGDHLGFDRPRRRAWCGPSPTTRHPVAKRRSKSSSSER